jgi:DNA-binding MurR/RpiR family transcriptional regulator
MAPQISIFLVEYFSFSIDFFTKYVKIMEIHSDKRRKMESLVHKIRYMYSQMGPGERKLADYLLENTDELINLSVSELASRCSCGDATVVRFSRRLGFGGYQAMKIVYAAELNRASAISSEIEKSDSCLEIFRKRINDISASLWSTESVLDGESLDKAATAIMNAKRIVVFGLGNSASIAQDAAHKFLRLGLNAQSCCDNHMQAIIASHLDRDSVAIGISHSGSSKDIVEAMSLSKVSGATGICVTNYSTSPIVKASDIALFTKSEETKHSILAMTSRIAALAIFDAIYTYLVVKLNNTASNAIYNTEYALTEKKY